MSGLMGKFREWLDHRTGISGLIHEALYEHIPGGARWRYAWGSTLVFAFTVQAITGIFLWMSYSPSGQTAWESVYYVQHEMAGGWLLRGLHHFMAQAMVVLLALHMLQVVIDGAYRAPREVNFWLGLVLMLIVLGLSLTGYLLPWDQKGFWATRVATNIMGIAPVVGEGQQQLVVGGNDYGHHTLTRFFALHAGVLPAALVGFLALHIAIFRKHGLHAKLPLKRPDSKFWPDQVLKDGVACLAVLLVVLFFVVKPALPWVGEHRLADVIESERPGDYLGAELGAPADASNEYSAARPEWYFLFLFQFLKFFEGGTELAEQIGALYIPAGVMVLLFLMPILGRWRLGHRFNVLWLGSLLLGIVILTGQALYEDHQADWFPREPGSEEAQDEKYAKSRAFLDAVARAEEDSQRVVELAREHNGIPASGALSLLRNDPKTEGRRLFVTYCRICHDHKDADGRGIASDSPSAPNLFGFGTKSWLEGLLDPQRIASPEYFGKTKHVEGEMAKFVQGDLSKDENRQGLDELISALTKEADRPRAEAQAPSAGATDAKAAAGRSRLSDLLNQPWGDMKCSDCHRYSETGAPGGEGPDTGPDLTGYGSQAWLMGMISKPSHALYYGGGNDRMPDFESTLEPRQIELIARWLRRDWYEPPSSETASTDE